VRRGNIIVVNKGRERIEARGITQWMQHRNNIVKGILFLWNEEKTWRSSCHLRCQPWETIPCAYAIYSSMYSVWLKTINLVCCVVCIVPQIQKHTIYAWKLKRKIQGLRWSWVSFDTNVGRSFP
jgi:hypothetical protein